MDDREVIAERVIWAVDKNSRGFDIALMIGKPYQITDTPNGDWACPVALIGLHGAPRDIRGVDSWQALTLAQEVLRVLLELFVESGGKLFWEKDGEEITVESLFLESRVEAVDEEREPLPALTEEQQARVDQLTAEEVQKIDEALMAGASKQLRKVAFLVMRAIRANRDSIPDVPDVFCVSRVQKLVEEGRLVAEGDLDHPRFSEVKLPD
jgi:hypothetical protein